MLSSLEAKLGEDAAEEAETAPDVSRAQQRPRSPSRSCVCVCVCVRYGWGGACASVED